MLGFMKYHLVTTLPLSVTIAVSDEEPEVLFGGEKPKTRHDLEDDWSVIRLITMRIPAPVAGRDVE